MSQKTLKKGDILYKKGELSTAAFIIEAGAIMLVHANGQTQFSKGDVIGVFDCFMNRPYSADAIACNDVSLTEIPKDRKQAHLGGTLTFKVVETVIKKIDGETPGVWS